MTTTVTIQFEIDCTENTLHQRLCTAIHEQDHNSLGLLCESVLSVDLSDTTEGSPVILSEPEQQFIWDRLFIEHEQGLSVYGQSDLDCMSDIMDKLQPLTRSQ